MEAEFSDSSKPAWMDDMMNDMKNKLESVNFQEIIKKFMTFFKSSDENKKTSENPSGFEKLFENGFPKIPEKFLKGHMAKLAQEIVKDITPEDLGINPEMVSECEKNPSRAFDILFQVFSSNPGSIQKVVQKIGKRLQQKIMSGAIRPQEIAREAEELMKEFADNSSFVDMMDGIKGAFGFQDMDIAKAAGRESSARLSMVKERLKKKAAEKEAKKSATTNLVPNNNNIEADAVMKSLLNEEAKNTKSVNNKMPRKGGKK
jgi:signal recognition particle subunit SEC65